MKSSAYRCLLFCCLGCHLESVLPTEGFLEVMPCKCSYTYIHKWSYPDLSTYMHTCKHMQVLQAHKHTQWDTDMYSNWQTVTCTDIEKHTQGNTNGPCGHMQQCTVQIQTHTCIKTGTKTHTNRTARNWHRHSDRQTTVSGIYASGSGFCCRPTAFPSRLTDWLPHKYYLQFVIALISQEANRNAWVTGLPHD